MMLPLEGATTAPALSSTPDGEEMAREYPPLAQGLSLSGSATITCTSTTGGRLSNCHVDRETPAGLGFGAAALRLSAYFMMKPGTIDGRAVQGPVTIPIYFQPYGDRSPKPLPISPPTSPAALDLARQVLAMNGVAADLHQNYKLRLDQVSARLTIDGDPKAGATVLDAFRAGLDDAITEEVDRQARMLASAMTADQLGATLAYLTSPAGVAWRQAEDRINAPHRPNLSDIVGQDARRRLCTLETCDASGEPAVTPAAP